MASRTWRPFPGGYLTDRLGAKTTLLIFNLVAMAGFALVAVVAAWPAVIGGAFLFISWTAISLPATMSLVARVLPKSKRTLGVSKHSLVRDRPARTVQPTGTKEAPAGGDARGSGDRRPSPLVLARRMSPALKRLLVAFGGAFLWRVSPLTNLLGAAAFGTAGAVWFALRGTHLTYEASAGSR